MFNDILPSGWFTGSGSVGEAVDLVTEGRQAFLVARISQAMAELCHGEVFLIVSPDINPYTIPKDTYNATPNFLQSCKSQNLLMLPLMRANRMATK